MTGRGKREGRRINRGAPLALRTLLAIGFWIELLAPKGNRVWAEHKAKS
jgi:hypothetical protein